MRSRQEVETVQALVDIGVNDCEIARRTGIPRGTVKDWRRGLVPTHRRRALEVAEDGLPKLVEEHEEAYAYLLGLYLGDGDITRGARVFRLRIALDGAYPAIVEACRQAVSEVFPNKVSVLPTPSRAVMVAVYSNAIPLLFPQHGPGMKHEREISLTAWQRRITRRHPEAFVRGLIHSDGTRCLNTVKVRGKSYAYPRYQFCNYSADIRGLFCEHLDALSIPWRQMNRVTISVARRDGVARLDEFVGPKR